MPTRNVNLTEMQDRFVGAAVDDGRYQNASEVVREGLRLLERRDAEDDARLTRFRALIAEADAEVARGELIDIDDAALDNWIGSLGTTLT